MWKVCKSHYYLVLDRYYTPAYGILRYLDSSSCGGHPSLTINLVETVIIMKKLMVQRDYRFCDLLQSFLVTVACEYVTRILKYCD